MSEHTEKVITRFPPSPTGFFHVGGVRTALFNYLFAKKNGGSFILRIEDTDKERSKKEYETDIIESLNWLGFSYDNSENIIHQSERKEVYKKYLQKLLDSGAAYISKEELGGSTSKSGAEVEPPRQNRRSEVIRFKNPNNDVTFQDLIRGEVSMNTTDLKDFVIAKSLDEVLYHFAVVVDDFESGITHVIRGEDHISNTPRQILIQEAIGAPRPIYAHLPLILAEDRSKLSKRKHGERVSLSYYREQGFLRDAIINYMALLGWNPGTDQELFTIEELIKIFDISRVQKSGAIFSDEKLKWFNKEYMKKIPEAEFISKITEITYSLETTKNLSEETIKKLSPILLEHSSTFGEIKTLLESGELDFLYQEPSYPAYKLFFKAKDATVVTPEAKEALIRRLNHVKNLLDTLQKTNFTKETIKNTLWDYATAEGRGEVLWPLRYALSKKKKSPDPFILAELLGKEKTLKRLQEALRIVEHA